MSDLNQDENSSPTSLSPDYLAYQIDHLGFSWEHGVTLSDASQALSISGQPHETSYPYDGNNINRPTISPGFIPPPFYKSKVGTHSKNFNWIQSSIESGKPVGIVIGVKSCLFTPINGVVIDQSEPESNMGHAVIGVGMGVHCETSEPHVLIRNSWGEEWGIDGHAWIPKTYLDTSLKCAFEQTNGQVI